MIVCLLKNRTECNRPRIEPVICFARLYAYSLSYNKLNYLYKRKERLSIHGRNVLIQKIGEERIEEERSLSSLSSYFVHYYDVKTVTSCFARIKKRTRNVKISCKNCNFFIFACEVAMHLEDQ